MEDTEGTATGSETTEEQTLTATPEGTDPNAEATAESNTEEEDGEDPIEALVAERTRLALEAAEREIEERVTARYQAQTEAARRSQLEAAEREKLSSGFTDAMKTARQNLQSIKYFTEDGQEATFTDELIEQLVIAPFQKHNATVQQTIQSAERTAAMVALGEAALNIIPETVREDFAKKADGKPLDVWLRTVIEHGAPESEYVKRIKDEEKARLLAAEARGFAKGQKAPSGTPRVTGTERAIAAGQVDLTTQSGIARALADGAINEEKYRELRAKLSRS